MADYGAQDTSTTSLGANQFPISEAWTPNAGFSAVEGGPQSTDAGGKKSAPVSVYAKDGSNVTQGAQADAAYTDGTGAASGTSMGLFKGIFVKLAAIAGSVAGTLKVKGDFTEVAGQGTGVVNAANTDFLPITDISAYRWFSATIAGTWTATLTVQVSNDATFTTFQTLVVQKSDAQVANFLSISANGTYGQTLGWRYMRVRATSFTSNASLAGIFEFYTTPPSSLVMGVTQLGTWTVQPGNTANTTPWLMSPQVASAGGSVPYHNLTAATTNFTNVKGAAAQMYGCRLSNTSAAVIFVKFYDKATAPGTGDVPKTTIQVPANSLIPQVFPNGLKFANGFGWAATGAVGDADNTAIAANCVVDFDLNS